MKKKLLLLTLVFGLLQPFAAGAGLSPDDGDNNHDQPGLEIQFEQNGVTNRIFIPLPILYAILQMRALQNRLAEQREQQQRQQRQHPEEQELEDDGEPSRFKPVKNVTTKFSDVGGAHAAKRELQEIVDFLKHPEKYREIGDVKVPHGIMLNGAPGNGKTLLARAVAGEAEVPFFSVKGSEFIELYVGNGAKTVRELFEAARKYDRCIIFIDEIDSIGAKRTGESNGGGHEYAQTLNQLLTEMDGFEKTNIIVMAATNRLDMLDEALIRPGRFDRIVEVPNPDAVGRKEILTACLRKIKCASDINVNMLACCTSGFSGAQLANLVNEAALHAVAQEKKVVDMQDFDVAQDKIVMGNANDTLARTPADLKKTAYHEAGHALVTLLMPDVTDPLYKVTIESRGAALGFAATMPDGDRSSYSKDELEARMMTALAGRVGEEICTGKQFVGVSQDLKYATGIAHDMVCKYGMSDLGLVACSDKKDSEKIDNEVRKIINECETKTRELIGNNRDKLDRLAQELLKKKTLTAEEIYRLLNITPRVLNKIGK